MPGSLKYSLASRFEATYGFLQCSVRVSVDVRTALVFKLSATKGYEGLLFERLKPGMSVAAAFDIEPRLFYFEPEGLILCKGVEGVCLDVNDDDPPPEMVPSLNVEAISVYLPYPEFSLPPDLTYSVHRFPAG